MPTLKAFMTRLATDQDALTRFIANPQQAALEADLTDADRAVLFCGDPNRIHSSVAGTPADASPSEPVTFHDERLIIVGTGIRSVGQMTMESLAWIRKADKVLFGAVEPISEEIVRTLNPKGAESLHPFFIEGKPRPQIYHEIADHILNCVRAGSLVCVVVYGHPGVFVDSTHEALRRARAEGFKARMLPGISAEDCLYADLGVDPAAGCQSYESTDFVMHSRIIDPSTHLILWQIGVLGNLSYRGAGYQARGMEHLLRQLSPYYPPHHVVCLYEAAVFPGVEPNIRPLPLYSLPQAPMSAVSTLYVPPSMPPRNNPAYMAEVGLA